MSSIVNNKETNIQYIKGVGPVKSKLFNNLNIYTLSDLIEHFPRSYEDRTTLKKIREIKEQENNLFIGTIVGKMTSQKFRKNLVIHSVFVKDNTGVCKLNWFNQNYLKNKFKENDTYIFYGKAINEYGRTVIDNPQIYNIDELNKILGIYPIYTLTSGITQNYIFKLVNDVLSNDKITYDEIFSEDFRKNYDLCEINESIKKIHFPKKYEDVDVSRRRIIFEELFLFKLALLSIKEYNETEKSSIKFNNTDISEFLELLPFKLTNAQSKVVLEIINDFKEEKVMNRLVQGDVGSGKTILAAIAIYIAVKNGYQAALMAPTTILATQHFLELQKYFEKLGINTECITSSTTKKAKEKIVQKLKEKELDIIIGTHSLLEDNIEFSNLGLVVTDEQHRFGVKQRMKLNNKGKDISTLIMTATPIPRTLALMLYADLDLSIVDELPPGRKLIKTYAINESYESRVNLFIKKQIDEGRQVYVVCSLVEENEELNLTSVNMLTEKYKNSEFSGLVVECLHGKMKNKEKAEIMERFKANEINILISTTVIEVGVNVPNATIMIIENADRFGLAALHQLRGRVGRGEHQSYCILKSNNRSNIALERLKIMEKSNSGFDIAQKDLELRGPGDFFGIRQHGLPEFKLANLLNDVNLLKEANQAATELIKKDPKLNNKENEKLKEKLYLKFGEQLKNIGT